MKRLFIASILVLSLMASSGHAAKLFWRQSVAGLSTITGMSTGDGALVVEGGVFSVYYYASIGGWTAASISSATALALAANGANCAAGLAPLGVDQYGASETCTDIMTQVEGDLKANLAGPTFTGTVTIPTPFTLGAISVTATGAELNFLSGVSSNVQAQINGKQDYHANIQFWATVGASKSFYSDNTGVLKARSAGTPGTVWTLGSDLNPTWSPASGAPGGSDSHIQWNCGGNLCGVSGFYWDNTLKDVHIDNSVYAKYFISSAADGERGWEGANTNDMSAPAEGWCWYNKTADVVKCYDGTDNVVVASVEGEIAWTYASPTSSSIQYRRAKHDMTVTGLYCFADPGDTGETITVTVKECDSNGDSCVDGGISVAAGNTMTSDLSFTDANIDAGDVIEITYTTTDTITTVNCSLYKKET